MDVGALPGRVRRENPEEDLTSYYNCTTNYLKKSKNVPGRLDHIGVVDRAIESGVDCKSFPSF